MSKIPVPCLDCSMLTTKGSRCGACQAEWEAKRNAKPERQAYKDSAYRSYVLADRCAWCGSKDDLTRDHIIPISKGGTNSYSNLRTLCRECNSRRRNLMQ